MHDTGTGFATGPREFDLYERSARAAVLPVRVHAYACANLVAGLPQTRADAVPLRARRVSDRFAWGGVKLWADGSIQGLSAALHEPYHCRPDLCGALLHPREQLVAIVEAADAARLAVVIHANGDAAIDAALDAFEAVRQRQPHSGTRHRIEHAQMASDVQLRRAARLDVGISLFINHVYYLGGPSPGARRPQRPRRAGSRQAGRLRGAVGRPSQHPARKLARPRGGRDLGRRRTPAPPVSPRRRRHRRLSLVGTTGGGWAVRCSSFPHGALDET